MSDAIEKVSIPAGTIGTARIDHFDVPEKSVQAMRLAMQGRSIRPGRYTRLTINGALVMTDTPAEMRDHIAVYQKAHSHVLINGLGLGMIANAIAKKPGVESVTVVERNLDVIALVAGTLHPLVRVEHADAFTFKPTKGVRFGAVWHDIWNAICADNLPEMASLKRRYARKTHWQGCWAEAETRRYARRWAS